MTGLQVAQAPRQVVQLAAAAAAMVNNPQRARQAHQARPHRVAPHRAAIVQPNQPSTAEANRATEATQQAR